MHLLQVAPADDAAVLSVGRETPCRQAPPAAAAQRLSRRETGVLRHSVADSSGSGLGDGLVIDSSYHGRSQGPQWLRGQNTRSAERCGPPAGDHRRTRVLPRVVRRAAAGFARGRVLYFSPGPWTARGLASGMATMCEACATLRLRRKRHAAQRASGRPIALIHRLTRRPAARASDRRKAPIWLANRPGSRAQRGYVPTLPSRRASVLRISGRSRSATPQTRRSSTVA